jgi:hypothetical protein
VRCRSLGPFLRQLQREGRDVGRALAAIEDAVVKVILSGQAKGRFSPRVGGSCFDLFGVDVLLDRSLRAWVSAMAAFWTVQRARCGAVTLFWVFPGAGGDHGIDHNKNWLRFPYISMFWRSHHLPPHPYALQVLELNLAPQLGIGPHGARRCIARSPPPLSLWR